MKIAIYHNLPSGGAKRHTFEQVRELARRGHDLVEYAPSTADLEFCSFAPYVREERIFDLQPVSQLRRRIPGATPYIHAVQGLWTLRRTARANKQIANEIDASNHDVVLAKDCQLTMNPYVLRYLKTPAVFQCHHGLMLRVKPAQPSGSPQISHIGLLQQARNLYYLPPRRLYEWRFHGDERKNIQGASRVITNSQFSRQLLSNGYGVNAHVVYPGINISLFGPTEQSGQHYVLSVGALRYQKGHRFVIAALAKIQLSRRPGLFIAANNRDPEEEEVVRRMASTLGVELHIERIADDRRLVQVYNGALAFVYAPMGEALGMAPLEAMACGTPVVAVGEGGVCETVLDGVTGWLVKRDEALFAERLDELLNNESARREMGSAGVEYVRQSWTWEKAVDRLEAHLRAVK